MAMRTHPPPRFYASGSGRDTFNNIAVERKDSNDARPDAFGFGPDRYDPALIHRPKSSAAQVARQRDRTFALSRPRTASEEAGFGLIVPGSNLRKY